jgi:hypothetical protein
MVWMQFLILVSFFSAKSFADAVTIPKPAPQYSYDCGAKFIPADALKPLTFVEAQQITDVTGIRLFELTTRIHQPTDNVNFDEFPNKYDKNKFSIKIFEFLKSLPVDFLKKNSDICFVLVNRFPAKATGYYDNVIMIPTDVTSRAIAHSFMRAVDFLHSGDSVLESWSDINTSHKCVIERPENAPVYKPGFPDMDKCYVSRFANTERRDDRAELFAAMIGNYNLLYKMTPPGTALEEKIKTLKIYLKELSPQINESFWFNHSKTHRSWKDR